MQSLPLASHVNVEETTLVKRVDFWV